MVSRRLWFPDEELKADRVSQAQKMLGDAFKGVKDAAGTAQKTVQDQFEEDRLGWAQKQMEQAFSGLRQAPQPQKPEPIDVPEATPSAAPPSTDSLTPQPFGQVHFGPTPGVDTPEEETPTPSPSPSAPSTSVSIVPPKPEEDRLSQAKSLLGDTFKGIRDAAGNLGQARDTAMQQPASSIGDTFSDLGTKVNDLGFRAPGGSDGKGILGNTGLGEAVRGADQWSQNVMPTPKSLSEPTGLLGEQGPLMKSLNPDVGNDPNLAGLKLGLESSGYPSQAKGAVRTGRDWMESLDKIGAGADKLTGADSTLQERGAGAADLGMGAIGAFAPQFTYIGNVAAERAKELGYDDDKAETIGAVVGFLTPGGGAEQLGKAGAYARRTQDAGSRIGRLGGLAEDFARTTGNIGESAEDLAKLGRFRSLAPAAAMGVAAPIGGVMGARSAAEKDGATAGDIALGGVGGAFRAADIAGGVSEMGLGAGAKALAGARGLPGMARRIGGALREGTAQDAIDNVIAYHGTADTYKKPRPGGGIFGNAHYLSSNPRVSEIYASDRANTSFHTAVQDKLQAERELAAMDQRTDLSPEDRQSEIAWNTEQIRGAQEIIDRGNAGDSAVIGPGTGSPQIRPTDIPDDVRLMDLNAPLDKAEATQILSIIMGGGGRKRVQPSPEVLAKLDMMPTNAHFYEAIADPPRKNFSPQKVHDMANVVNRALRMVGYDGVQYVGDRSSVLPDDKGGMEPYTEYAIFPDSMQKIRNALTGKPFGITPDGATSVDGKPTRGLKLDAAGEVLGGLAGAQLTSQGPLADEMIDDENDPNARLKRAGLGALGFAVGSQAGGAVRKNARTFQRVADAFKAGEAPGGRERVIPPAAARGLSVNPQPNDFEWGRKSGFMPNRLDVAHSIRNTKGARLFPDGTLEVEQWRYGKPRRELGETGRGGVFYAATEEQANMYNSGDQAGEGGNVLYQGPTALRNVLFVDETGSMGRDIGSSFLGKAGYEEAERALDGLLRRTDDASKARAVERFQALGWQPDEAVKIVDSLRSQRSRHGTSYALPESIASGLLRSNGYEAAVGVQRAQDGPHARLGEIFDVREAAYPGQGPQDYRVQPEFSGATPRSLVPGKQTDPILKQIARASTEGRLPKGMDSKTAVRDTAVLDHLGLDGPSYDMLPQQGKMVLDRYLFDDDPEGSVRSVKLPDVIKSIQMARGGSPTSRWSSQAAYEGQQGGSGMSSQEYKKALKAPNGSEQYLADIGSTASPKGVVYDPSIGKYLTVDPTTGSVTQSSSYFSAELKLLKNFPNLKAEEVNKAPDLQAKANSMASAAPGTPGASTSVAPDSIDANPAILPSKDEVVDVKSWLDFLDTESAHPTGTIFYNTGNQTYMVKTTGEEPFATSDWSEAQKASVNAGEEWVPDSAKAPDYDETKPVWGDDEMGMDYVPPMLSVEESQDVWESMDVGFIWQDSADKTFFVKTGPLVSEWTEFPTQSQAKNYVKEQGLLSPEEAETAKDPSSEGMQYANNTPEMEAAWPFYKMGDVVYNNDTDGYHVKTAENYQDSPYYIEKSEALKTSQNLKPYETTPEDEEAALDAAAKALFGDSTPVHSVTVDSVQMFQQEVMPHDPVGTVAKLQDAPYYFVKTGPDTFKTAQGTYFAEQYKAEALAGSKEPEGAKAPAEKDWTKPVTVESKDFNDLDHQAPPGAVAYLSDAGYYGVKQEHTPVGGDWVQFQSEKAALDDAAKVQAKNPSFWQKLKAGFKAFGNDDANLLGVRRAGGDEAERGPFGAAPARTPEEIHAEQETLRRIKPSPAAQRQREAVAEAGAINEQGGTGQGATNPTVRATGPNSPGNLRKIRQRSGNPAGGPHTPGWDEATMGTKPTSEFDDEKTDIPPVEALAARAEPITMADAQAIMSRQAADVRREEMVVSEMDALPDEVKAQIKSLGFLKKRLAGMKAALPAQQQAVRELAERNARAQGETAAGLATNVKREANRTGRRQVNRAAREEADRAAVFGTDEGSTDVAGAVEDAGGKVQETEAGDRVVDAEGRVVAPQTPAEVDLDGKPTTTTRSGKPTTQDLTPDGGVAPGGVVEPGGRVEPGATVGAGATVGSGSDIGAGTVARPGTITRPGATVAPGMLRAPVQKVSTTTTTTAATPGVPAITTTTGSVTSASTRTRTRGVKAAPGTTPPPPTPPPPPKAPRSGSGKGSGKTPKATPTPPTPPTPQPQMADTGWLDERGRLKPLDQLEGTIRAQLEGDYAKWEQYQADHAQAKDAADQARITADYEASVEKMKASRAAQIAGLSEQEMLDLASKEVWARQLMDRSVAYGATGKNQEYGARDFATNYARANLIGANPITMARNAVGGAASLVWHPIEAAGSAVFDPIAAWRLARKGLDVSYDRRYGKEIGYIVNGYWRALPAALTNFTAAMDRGQAYTAQGLDEQLVNQIKGGNRATTTMRGLTDQLLKPLTATDAFFRTLTQGGELMRQSYRQMKSRGMTDAQIDAEQIKLLQGPRADYVKKFGEMETEYLAKGVDQQVKYRAFAQGLKDEDQFARSLQWLQNQPGGQLILPFVTTPYNAAKFDLERSPVGFAKALKTLAMPPEQKIKVTGSVGKTLNAKADSPDLTVGELSDRLSRGMAGSALFAALMTGAITGRFDMNGPLPESQDERDEWEAQGRKPYTIRIADRYVSFQDIPGLNASLTTAALIKDIMNRNGDGDKELPELIGKGILEATRSLAARPMAGGLLDLAQSIGSPGQTGASQINSMLSPMLPASGITRTVTTAMDKMQREQPVTGPEMLDRVYRPKNLPAKRTAWGDEMGNQNFGLPGVANPFRTTATNQFEAPTRYVTSDNAATDVAIGRAKSKVDAWKRDPVNMPMPDMNDFINAELATAAKDPYTAYLRGEERTQSAADTARRKSSTLDSWLAEPVRR